MWYLKGHDSTIWGWNQIFNKEQCEKIIELGTNQGLNKGTVLNNNKTARNSNVSWAKMEDPNWEWVYRSCTDAVNFMNDELFKYDLKYIEELQFTSYSEDEKQFYKKHTDLIAKDNNPRKLSFSILLSDPKDFEGGDLLLHMGQDPSYGYKEQGKATFFNSMVLHEVTPVTKGTRYSLVGWVCGPPFK